MEVVFLREWEAKGVLNEQANSVSLCLCADKLGA